MQLGTGIGLTNTRRGAAGDGIPNWPPAQFTATRDFGGVGSSTLSGTVSGSISMWEYIDVSRVSGADLYDSLVLPPGSGPPIIYNGGVGGEDSSNILDRVDGSTATVNHRFNARMKAMDICIQLGGAYYGGAVSPEDQVRLDGAAILVQLGHNRFIWVHKHYDAIAQSGNRDHTRLNRLVRLDHAAFPGKTVNVALMFNKVPPIDGNDAADQNKDMIPRSKQVDNAHPNTAGNELIALNCYFPFAWAMQTGNGFVPQQENYFEAPTAINTSGVVVGTIPHHPETTITGSTFETNDARFSAALESGNIVLRRANATPITDGYTDIGLDHTQGGVKRKVWQRVRITDSTPSDARVYNPSQWMVREKGPSNVTNNGKRFSFAMLIRVVSGDATGRIIAKLGNTSGVVIDLKTSNRMGCTIRNNTDTATAVNLDSGTGANLITVASGWRAVFFCADTTTGVQTAKWVIDNNAASSNVPTADALLNVMPAGDYQSKLFTSVDTGTSLCDIELGALWAAEGYVDWTSSTNRDAFRNSTTMRSVLTGTGAVAGVTPFLWMQGPAGNWSSGLNLAAPGDFWDATTRAQWVTV